MECVNIGNVPYLLENIKACDASPFYQAEVPGMIAESGKPLIPHPGGAVNTFSNYPESGHAHPDEELHPMAAAVRHFLETSGDLVPAISSDPRAEDDLPDEVRELAASHPPIRTISIDTDGAVRHMLPSKETGIT